MQTVDRRGVHIDQCQGCRGIFLDRGELEQVATAEQNYYAAPAPPPYQESHRAAAYRGDSPPPYGHRGGYADSPPPYGKRRGHRRRSFLEELFD